MNAKSQSARRLVRLRRVFRSCLVLIILWLALSPRMLPGLYTNKLFHPDKDNGTAQDVRNLAQFNGVPNHSLDFTARDGSRLRGWIFQNPKAVKDRIFLVCPGNAGDIPKRLEFFKTLLSTGASIFTYEPRGFGKSEGKPSIAHICEDGESAYDYLTGVLGYKPEQIVIYGISLGTTVATHVSTVRAHKAMILQSGFASLPRIAREKVAFLKIYPDWLFPQNPALNNVSILARKHQPLLIIHGGMDNIIDISHSQEMYDRAQSPRRLVICPRSSHVNIDSLDQTIFRETVTRFLAQLN
jgi:fermentation-respiration switch protein FrsA (DUF1100 family)